MIYRFTTFHRALLKSLRSRAVCSPDGTPNAVPLPVFPVGAPPEVKNAPTSRYPGISIHINAPRENDSWQPSDDTKWLVPNPDEPGKWIVRTSGPQKTFLLDYRLTAQATNQPQFDDVVRTIYSAWRVPHGQLALAVPSDTEEGVDHLVEVRISVLATRHRPNDGVLLADYLVSVPAAVILDVPEDFPVIESFEVYFGVASSDDPNPQDTELLTP